MMQPPLNDASLTAAAKQRWAQIAREAQKRTGMVASSQQLANLKTRKNPGKKMDRDVIKRMGLP